MKKRLLRRLNSRVTVNRPWIMRSTWNSKEVKANSRIIKIMPISRIMAIMATSRIMVAITTKD